MFSAGNIDVIGAQKQTLLFLAESYPKTTLASDAKSVLFCVNIFSLGDIFDCN